MFVRSDGRLSMLAGWTAAVQTQRAAGVVEVGGEAATAEDKDAAVAAALDGVGGW